MLWLQLATLIIMLVVLFMLLPAKTKYTLRRWLNSRFD